MSKHKIQTGKRKYYKRCINMYAWRFAPTGAIQSEYKKEMAAITYTDQDGEQHSDSSPLLVKKVRL